MGKYLSPSFRDLNTAYWQVYTFSEATDIPIQRLSTKHLCLQGIHCIILPFHQLSFTCVQFLLTWRRDPFWFSSCAVTCYIIQNCVVLGLNLLGSKVPQGVLLPKSFWDCWPQKIPQLSSTEVCFSVSDKLLSEFKKKGRIRKKKTPNCQIEN